MFLKEVMQRMRADAEERQESFSDRMQELATTPEGRDHIVESMRQYNIPDQMIQEVQDVFNDMDQGTPPLQLRDDMGVDDMVGLVNNAIEEGAFGDFSIPPEIRNHWLNDPGLLRLSLRTFGIKDNDIEKMVQALGRLAAQRATE